MNWKVIFSFVVGAAVGGGAAYVVTKRMVEKRCDQEIDELREFYSDPNRKSLKEIMDEAEDISEGKEEEADVKQDKTEYRKSDLAEMAAKVRNNTYVDYSGSGRSVDTSEEASKDERDIFLITEDDFRLGTYEKRSLTYYGDHILADDDDGEIIEEVENTVTYAALDEFKDDGVIYVRNDYQFTDFEISEDPRPYAEAYKAF